ncbi:hypothetical protein Kfla_2533 [Kribbella flavida DSM 17836]|uniref:Uncharacterized protein n=1 Tax=Kribbella flavida (strain DSM 17836 / JCM 10339 / NBRC 14399) TaxID=479435 RepID=D2PWF2_KRIFD|nr:hypothetical protein [Kribbella flavida]ADB31604.1 hypothetical protein Kfla_2533 [Kribbella flavida DSM 17836]
MRTVRLLALLLAGASMAAACSADQSAEPQPITWSRVQLPAEPVVLAGSGDQLVVGLRDRGAKVVPRLLLVDGDRQQEIKVAPTSPYAFLAVWTSIAYDGRRVLALGGAAGGAHSNVRWTVWTGTTAGLTELPQTFNTFGGQDAGHLYSAVITPAGQALLGSWASTTSGLDAAVWLPQGTKWIRQDSTGTVLRSTPTLLAGPGAATSWGDAIVQTGSQVRLAPNVVQQEAAVWRSTKLNDGWSRFALPEPGARSQGLRVTCGEKLCTVAGWVEGKLALWQFDPSAKDGAGAKRLTGLPEIAVGDKAPLPAPVLAGDEVIQMVAGGNQIKVVGGRDGAWTVRASTGPSGEVKEARLVGRTLYLLAGATDAPATLWKTDLG